MPYSPSKDFYGVLGIKSTASSDDVRKAYRKKALETHPDKLDPNASEAEKQSAEEQFHKVHEAFETLGDAIKRKAYDTRRKAQTNHPLISEDAARKVKERKEWADRQREESEKRLVEFMAKLEREKRAKQEAVEKVSKEAALVAEMVKEMYALNPEFAARREAALRLKAARERTEMLRSTHRPIRS